MNDNYLIWSAGTLYMRNVGVHFISIMMDHKAFWIVYYSISLLLSVMAIKGTKDNGFKMIATLFAVAFFYFLISHLGIGKRMGFEFITITIACIWYIAKRIGSSEIRLLDKVLLTILPFVTATRLGFKVLHLPEWYELGLISLMILIMTAGYLSVIYFKKRPFSELQATMELNGLFGIILIPTLI